MLRTKGFQVIPDGERLILELPGGAGMGDPTTRDPALVARDVRDGLVSAANARVALQGRGRRGWRAWTRPPPRHCELKSDSNRMRGDLSGAG